MSSIREQAIQAVVNALTVAEGSPAKAVTRSRLDQIDECELPVYDVAPGTEKDGAAFGDHDSWPRSLEVKVRAIIDATDADDGALDPLYIFAVQTVTADPTLGGVVDDVEWLGADSVFRPEGRDILGLELTFELKFAVKRGDPTQRG